MISTEQVKELRDKTGVSIMQCQKALTEAEGDMKKAEIILQRQGRSIAEKKSDRDLGSGIIQSYIHSNGLIGAMIDLACETDFVAKNEEFKNLAYDIAMQITASNPSYIKKEDIPEQDKKEAVEVLEKEVGDKPIELKAKILEGKIDSFFSEKILLEQLFIKDQDVTIKQLIESAIQKFGEKIEVRKFARFSI